nr:zinc finger BED domain-containing protein 5-like [Cherax quadricarinatus]
MTVKSRSSHYNVAVTLPIVLNQLNKKMSKKRTYTDAFLRHGFVNLTSGGEDRPQCVACHKVLTNESLKPSKLSAHLQKCHPNLQNKDQAYFQRQAVALKNIQFGSSGIQAQKLQAAVEASYCVAYKSAEQQKCQTIAENLIMPCAYEMVSKVCGEDQAKKLSVISLSNNTIRRRVDDMASDILPQVTTEIKESSYGKFSLQFDKSCDVASCAVLLGFVRYVHQDKIKEEFLLCEDLLTTTKGEDVFNIINSFFTKNGLDWNSVQQVSVDGAPSMMGGHRGLRGLIQAINQEISVDHCIIHRYSLGSKSLPGNLKLVFEDVLKIVNFIKSRDVNSRIFKELCKEMGEQYQVLLYHTDVRWLSRGKVVRRVIELRKAVQEFLEQKGSPFATKFTDKEWLARLCYLADIFAELNSGNLQLQGRNTTVIDAHHTVTAFLGKLRLWIRRLEKGVIAQFPTLDHKNADFLKIPNVVNFTAPADPETYPTASIVDNEDSADSTTAFHVSQPADSPPLHLTTAPNNPQSLASTHVDSPTESSSEEEDGEDTYTSTPAWDILTF